MRSPEQRVLGYTPDLYDAFLTFDDGAKFRVKAEWIKHIDGLVEFALDFSGSEGSFGTSNIPVLARWRDGGRI
ncbi:MAG: hypothetical protein U5L04_07145 [Trueperaceae bacterium]|nr:hypothetical protein [Trueperaceae bacterium]